MCGLSGLLRLRLAMVAKLFSNLQRINPSLLQRHALRDHALFEGRVFELENRRHIEFHAVGQRIIADDFYDLLVFLLIRPIELARIHARHPILLCSLECVIK